MSTAVYTGTLKSIGAERLADVLRVRLRVRPKEEAFGPEGIVSAAPLDVPLVGPNAAFSMTLIPSGELTGRSGRAGVDYILSVDRFEETSEGGEWLAGWDLWEFTAVAGGGNISDMKGGSLLAVWVGPPWPSQPLPIGLYVDLLPPNEWGIVASEGN